MNPIPKLKSTRAAIVALALLCAFGWTVAAATQERMRVPPAYFKPVPGIIFKLTMMSEPSVPDGYIAWRDVFRERCDSFGGKLIAQAGMGTYTEYKGAQKVTVQTMTITCEGRVYGA